MAQDGSRGPRTSFFDECPSVLLIFYKNGKNARDILKKGVPGGSREAPGRRPGPQATPTYFLGKQGGGQGSGERGKRRPSRGFERDATVSTLPLPDVHPAKPEEF